MTNTKDIIIKLKEVRAEKGLSYTDIMEMMEKNGDFLSKSTLSRIFSEGSEELSFRYEETLRPLVNAMLDIENIEETDSMDVQAMKTLLKYKSDRIAELERMIEHQKGQFDAELVSQHEKMDSERATWSRSIEFLKDQISKKDERIDTLFRLYTNLLEQYTSCPYNKKES